MLLLTAKAEVEDRIRGLDAGADDYLPIPFNMGELLARLRAMLRRRENFIPTYCAWAMWSWIRAARCFRRTGRAAS